LVSAAILASILNLANGIDNCFKSTILIESKVSFMIDIEGSTPVYIKIRSVMPDKGKDGIGANVGALV
jgi:hypothetical protein